MRKVRSDRDLKRGSYTAVVGKHITEPEQKRLKVELATAVARSRADAAAAGSSAALGAGSEEEGADGLCLELDEVGGAELDAFAADPESQQVLS